MSQLSISNPVRLSAAPLLVLALCLLTGGCKGNVDLKNDVLDTPALSESSTGFGMQGQSTVARAEDGMIASGHPLASEVGAEILAQGGNAIDAAVAVGFSLAVVLPRAGNLGGGGFLVYRSGEGEVASLDFREKAPAAAHRDMYLDEDGEPTDKSVIGHLAAGVPGSVAGLWNMHQRYGSMPWASLLAPAVEQAKGHEIDQTRAADIERAAERLSMFEASARQFLPGGMAPKAATMFRQPELAQTLQRIAELGAEGFYQGETARLIVDEMERGSGLISLEDLSSYEAVWRDAIEVPYRGYTVYTMPPPSSGGVALALLLNVLERWELPEFGSADLVQLETEAMRRAFIDRNRYLADPDFVEMPIATLSSQEYADRLADTIVVGQATPTESLLKDPVIVAGAESVETTHYSVVDKDGGAVSITTTLNGSFGNYVTVPEAGFLLNNEMDDFATAPGKPNMYGLVEGEANTVEPGKRMLSSMTPSILIDPEGNLSAIIGSPGGPTIITTVYHMVSNLIDHGMDLQQAIEAPRVHHQSLPDQLFVEKGGIVAPELLRLEQMGYDIAERDGYSGNVNAIRLEQGVWVGIGDPRRSGAAAGPP